MTKHFLVALVVAAANGLTAQAQATDYRLAPAAHQQSVVAFQQDLNKEFADPKESPLSATERQAFTTLPFYPTSYDYYVEATLMRDSTLLPFAIETSTAHRPLYRKYGELRFVLQGQPMRLSVYQSMDLLKRPGYEDYLFVPFTDATNGHGSYGGGRYLDLRIPPARASILLLDFNRAYNPSCAYNHAYSCPVPPAENRLSAPVPAGVKSEH